MRAYFRFLVVFSFLFVVGCTPMVQKAGTNPGDPVIEAGHFVAEDGYKMPVKTWESLEPEKAVIIALHGLNDYSNAFAYPASWWMQQRITTYAYDQRGFGETDQFGVWPGEERMIDDLIIFINLVKKSHPNTPVYLVGESLGGAVVMSAAIEEDFPKIDGIILSAPGVWGWQSLNFFYRGVLWVSARLFPEQQLSGKGLGRQASDNISMLRNLGRDPLFIKETRVSVVYGAVSLMDRAYESAGKQTPPLLLLYGAKDEIIPKHPVEDVARHLPSKTDKVLYPDGWHLLMRDLQAPVVWKDIQEWMMTREIPSGHKVEQLPLFKDAG